MKKNYGRFIGAILLPLFTLASLAGCSKDKDDVEVLEDDGKSWFESDMIRFDMPFGEGDEDDFEASRMWKCGDRYFSIMLDNSNERSRGVKLLEFDKEGKLTGQTDIDLFGEKAADAYIVYDTPTMMFDSKMIISCFYSDDEKNGEYYFAYDVLEKTAERLSYLDGLDPDSFVQDIDKTDDGSYCTLIGTFGETDDVDYQIMVSSADAVTSSRSISEAGLPGAVESIYDMSTGKDNVDVLLRSDANYIVTLDISGDKYDVTKLSGSGLFNLCLDNGSAFGFKETGLYKLTEDKETPCFLYENTNIIRNLVGSSEVIEASADNIILSGQTYFSDSKFVQPYVFDVSKASDDYISGRTVITASYLNNLDDYLDEVVYKFNKDNTEYYVKLTSDYLLDVDAIDESINWNSADADAQWERLYAEGKSEIIDRLAMNLISGDGPDIVFNAGNCSRLLSEDYFADISGLFERDMDKAEFFSNIIEDAKVDGKLYFVPLSFYLRGLSVDSRSAADGSGWSFDEYKTLVADVCNGIDPMEMDRKDCFLRLFDSEIDLFVNGRTVNLDSDEFKELATFCYENIPEQAVDSSVYEGSIQASAEIISDFSSYMDACKISGGKMTRSFTGYPSSDKRGPSAVFYNDVAIASKSSQKDGAWEFVKYLLNTDSQIEISASKNEIPVSKKAYETRVKTEFNDYQERINESKSGDKTAASRTADEGKIDEYMEVIASANLHLDCDPSVRLVVSEEIDAFFAGQKSIDQVAETIQNRASTVINEKD